MSMVNDIILFHMVCDTLYKCPGKCACILSESQIMLRLTFLHLVTCLIYESLCAHMSSVTLALWRPFRPCCSQCTWRAHILREFNTPLLCARHLPRTPLLKALGLMEPCLRRPVTLGTVMRDALCSVVVERSSITILEKKNKISFHFLKWNKETEYILSCRRKTGTF